MIKLKTPIILALDIDDFENGLKLVKQLAFGLGAIKIGPRLLMQHGAVAVKKLAEIAPVFVDNKYYDIPNTMESAIRQTYEAGATFATVHASAGREALKRLAHVEGELSRQRPFKILSVTMLTSFSQQTLPPNLKIQTIEKHVEDLADLTLSSGLTGLVCSPHEVKILRAKSASAFLVTPGIRFESSIKDDQSRVMSAVQALEQGASALVVGRPLLEAVDPKLALQKIIQDIGQP